MKRVSAVLVSLLCLLAAAPAFAVDVITAVTPSVAKSPVGKPFQVTVQGNLGEYASCRVYLMKGTDQTSIASKVASKDQPFPLTFDVTFDAPGPGAGNAAVIHVWVGTSGDFPCGGQSFPAVTVVVYKPGGPVITSVMPAVPQLKVGDKLKVTVDGVMGSYDTCRIYLMLNTDQSTTRHVDTKTLPISFDGITFTHPGPGVNNTAWIHTWTGTSGEFPCDGGSKDASVKVMPASIPEIRPQPGRQLITPSPTPIRPPR
jgi:hypothetical protein